MRISKSIYLEVAILSLQSFAIETPPLTVFI